MIAAAKHGTLHGSIPQSILMCNKQPFVEGHCPPPHTFPNLLLDVEGLIATFRFFRPGKIQSELIPERHPHHHVERSTLLIKLNFASYPAILDLCDGPRPTDTAISTRFLSDSFQERFKLAQHEILDLPLAVIVEPSDSSLLKTAVGKVLEDHEAITTAKDGDGRGGGVQGGSLVYLRVGWGGVLFSASMTITIGTQGMTVVTRLYDELRVP